MSSQPGHGTTLTAVGDIYRHDVDGLDPELESLLEARKQRHAHGLNRPAVIADVVLATALVAITVALAVFLPGGSFAPPAALIALVAMYAALGNIRIEVGAGHTSLVQPVFIALMFAVPPAYLPVTVLLAELLKRSLAVFVLHRGEHPSRLIGALADPWFAIGPAVILAATHTYTASMSALPIIAAAFVAQAAFDTVASTIREFAAVGVAPKMQAKLMLWIYAVDGALAPLGILVAMLLKTAPAAILFIMPPAVLLALFSHQRSQRLAEWSDSSKAYKGMVLLLTRLLEDDDAYTGGEHTDGVVKLSVAVAQAMGLSSRGLQRTEFGALLHDIGKMSVDKRIINKPGKLTDAEFEAIKRHAAAGADMITQVGGRLTPVGSIVRHHHERWDGTGYPDRIAGEEIPLESRIICACDAFNAMVTNRPYRRAMSSNEAIAELEKHAGTQFDPRVVRVLIEVALTLPNPPVQLRVEESDDVRPQAA